MGRPTAMQRRGGADEFIRIDASELSNLLKAAKDFDAKLSRDLRRAIRDSGDEIVDAMKDVLDEPPPAKLGRARYGRKTYRSKNGKKYKRRVIKSFDAREGGRVRSRGMREAIKRSLSTAIRTRKSESRGSVASVKITANANKMPSGMGPMVKAYNTSKAFRHPVFGDEDRWAYQAGRPYFGAVAFDPVRRKAMLAAIKKALDDAAAAMARDL
jgi:hypothetical protein